MTAHIVVIPSQSCRRGMRRKRRGLFQINGDNMYIPVVLDA